MTQTDNNRLKVLRTNVAAVRAIVETVAGTLGPKGLDVLLTDEAGRITVTNDGVEILSQLDAQHPAARLVIEAASAQDRAVGDGTTTATVLAGALLDAALAWVEQGVSVNPLLAGMRLGVRTAIEALREQARPIESVEDTRVLQVARIAAREDDSIAQVVWEAACRIGRERLLEGDLRLGDLVLSQTGTQNQWIDGVLIAKRPLTLPTEGWQRSGAILVLTDNLAPEDLDPQILATESGFGRFLQTQEKLRSDLQVLVQEGVVLVVCEKAIAPLAEEFIAEAGILALQRVLTRDTQRVLSFTGAEPARQAMLNQSHRLTSRLGKATVRYDREHSRVILSEGAGSPLATILVGAVSVDVAAERERIAIDACGALQAALKDGVVTGGGVAELICRRNILSLASQTEGLNRYGLEVVATALRRPIEQIVANSGYSALERVAALEAAHQRTGNFRLGIHCESGEAIDLEQAGVIDPVAVKIHALQAAAEIAERILRIQTIVRRREVVEQIP
ncbi:MAG: TCP-1/cpn60 chaperonin family protein [Gemmatimonadaceae bacterium]|nr:TCP-1/cpn60 chaperonin family protein [Gloeobacterales cyanobacterium ES-bin-141]